VRRIVFLALVLLAACSGPEAPDAALCRDVIHRICRPALCSVVTDKLGVGNDCEATLTGRTGCDVDTFAFTTPSRARVLDCRDPLLRNGDGVDDVASCQDIADTLSCADLVTFLGGTP
jgi:hypothetical protein